MPGSKKSSGLFVLCLFVAALSIGCGPKEEAPSPSGGAGPKPAGTAAATAAGGATSAATGDPILIGEYGSLTGSESSFGVSNHNGTMLAVDEFNAAGGLKGRPVKDIIYDDQGKPQEAGTAVMRLITSDKVVAVLGEVASALSIAGGNVAQQYHIPMISPSSTNPDVTTIGNMISRVCFIDPFQGYVCAKFTHDNLKATKVAVLYDQKQAYSVGLKEEFVKAFKKMGGTITTEQAYTGGDSDFNSQLTTIRGTNPDVLFIPGYYTDVGNIALQVRKLNITVPMVGGDGWDSPKLAEIAGPAIEGCYFSNHYASDEARPEVQEFEKKYREKFKVGADGMAALGYDSAKVLFDAMKRAKSLAPDDLAKAINETKDFHGVTGTITLDADRNAKKNAVIVQLKQGRPTFVTSITPE